MAKRHYSSEKKGAMLHEDRSAPCNLPRYVVEKDYEKRHVYGEHMIDDLYMGVQHQLDEDAADLKREMNPGKY